MYLNQILILRYKGDIMSLAIYYLMPAVLILVCICLIMCISKKNKKGIIKTLLIILVVSITSIFYYYPQYNILKGYSFTSINIHVGRLTDTEIINQDIINELIKVINRHAFIRSAVRTVEPQIFQSNELIRLDLGDTNGKGIVHLYILYEDFDKNLLQMNDIMYNVKDKKNLSKEVIGVLNEFGIAI